MFRSMFQCSGLGLVGVYCMVLYPPDLPGGGGLVGFERFVPMLETLVATTIGDFHPSTMAALEIYWDLKT